MDSGCTSFKEVFRNPTLFCVWSSLSFPWACSATTHTHARTLHSLYCHLLAYGKLISHPRATWLQLSSGSSVQVGAPQKAIGCHLSLPPLTSQLWAVPFTLVPTPLPMLSLASVMTFSPLHHPFARLVLWPLFQPPKIHAWCFSDQRASSLRVWDHWSEAENQGTLLSLFHNFYYFSPAFSQNTPAYFRLSWKKERKEGKERKEEKKGREEESQITQHLFCKLPFPQHVYIIGIWFEGRSMLSKYI